MGCALVAVSLGYPAEAGPDPTRPDPTVQFLQHPLSLCVVA